MLAEHSSRSGNFPTITRVLLKKLAPGDAKMSYSYDKYVRCGVPVWCMGACSRAHAGRLSPRLAMCLAVSCSATRSCPLPCISSAMYHYIIENNITYLCLTDDTRSRSIPFAYLEDIKARFTSAYSQRMQTAIAFAMNADFSRVLRERMVRVQLAMLPRRCTRRRVRVP